MTLLLAAALFLPLFPLSVVLNAVLARLPAPSMRCALLLLWPQLGVLLLQLAPQPIPTGFVPWALLTAGFYALRLLTVRDMGQWAGFLATSALALAWAYAGPGARGTDLHLFVFWFSLPAALVALLGRPIARRYGAAYGGLQGGMMTSLPRLSGVLALTVLAAVATPPFPGFFALLHLLHALDWGSVVGVLAIWLVWGWAGIRLMQGFLFGPEPDAIPADVGQAPTLAFAGVLGVLAIAGLYLTGGVL